MLIPKLNVENANDSFYTAWVFLFVMSQSGDNGNNEYSNTETKSIIDKDVFRLDLAKSNRHEDGLKKTCVIPD